MPRHPEPQQPEEAPGRLLPQPAAQRSGGGGDEGQRQGHHQDPRLPGDLSLLCGRHYLPGMSRTNRHEILFQQRRFSLASHLPALFFFVPSLRPLMTGDREVVGEIWLQIYVARYSKIVLGNSKIFISMTFKNR